jgi:phosphatidylglycerol phospholipase C
VVVISHDATLKRCFGRPEKILTRTWEEIKDLRTIQEPHEPMPRLTDLLAYLAEPGLENIWLLLDIKLDNDPATVMRLIASTLAASPPSAQKAWQERVVLGIWAAKYLPLAIEHLTGYPVMHIGFSVPYARHFLMVPNVGFNMLLPMLIAPGGRKFIRDVKNVNRQILAWTVNDVDRMQWCIRRKLDGVITDDPKKYLEICAQFNESTVEPTLPIGWRACLDVARIWLWITVMVFVFQRWLRPVASRELIVKK